MRSRTAHRVVAILWLLCQAATIAASPLPSCRDHGPAWGASVSHGAGGHDAHACPMHRPPSDASHAGHHEAIGEEGPSVRCRCLASDAPLASLILGTGTLSAGFVLPFDSGISPVATLRYSILAPGLALDTPPPRV